MEKSLIEAHLKMLRVRDEVSAEEERAITGLFSEVRDIPADKTVTRAGESLSASTLILDGLLCRYKDLRDGQRQITALHVPGDFADLHGFTLKRLDHNIMALTRCRIALAPHDRLNALTKEHPHLARLYWFLTNLDAAIHREWVLSLGLRTAASRIAHLLCELHVRLGIVGLTEDASYGLGLTQTDLAESLRADPRSCEPVAPAASRAGSGRIPGRTRDHT